MRYEWGGGTLISHTSYLIPHTSLLMPRYFERLSNV